MSGKHIYYYGKMLSLEEISARKKLDYTELAKQYELTGRNIHKAVNICREMSGKKMRKIEYKNGKMLEISTIAAKEKIETNALTRCYRETGDIFEAVRICKEKQAERKERRAANNLRIIFGDVEDVNKTKFLAEYEKRKNEVIEIKGFPVNLYDMSLLIGVRYRDLINLLNEGKTINEIKEKYVSQEAGEKIELPNGQTLLEYCTENKFNFAFMYRAIHTYGKTLQEAVAEYKNDDQHIPMSWVVEKYRTELNNLQLTASEYAIIINDLSSGKMSLEETIEKYVVMKNARENQLEVKWGEALYGLVKMREVLGEEFHSDISIDEKERKFIDESEVELLEIRKKMQEIPEAIIREDMSKTAQGDTAQEL